MRGTIEIERAVLAALVLKLGGSVTITAHDLHSLSPALELDVFVFRPRDEMTLRVTDPTIIDVKATGARRRRLLTMEPREVADPA